MYMCQIFPPTGGISSTFIVEDLVKFKGLVSISSDPFVHPSESDPKPSNSTLQNTPLLPELPACKEKIERILDEQVTLSRRGSY